MKHSYPTIIIGLLALVSCSKEISPANENIAKDEASIVFEASELDSDAPTTKSTFADSESPFSVICEPIKSTFGLPQTKVTATTSANLSGFYLTISSGSGNSLVSANNHYSLYSGTTFTPDSELCWPSSNPSYRFYASNLTMTASTGSVTVSCPEDTDVVCACNTSPSYFQKNTLTMGHVYSRIGALSINVPSGVTATLSSASVSAPKSGTYSLLNNSWASVASSKTISLNSSNDVWIVPGTYPMSVTFSLTDGYTTKSGITRSGNVAFTAGMVSSVKVSTSDCFTYVGVISPSSATLETGDTQSLAMTVKTYFSGVQLSERTVTSSATWTSSSSSVASVSSSGVVTAKAEGTATITGTTTIGGKTVTATCSVTVEDSNWSVVIE